MERTLTEKAAGAPGDQGDQGSRGVRLVPGGLEIGGEVVPLYAGSVHYWRLDPRDWRACLEATKALGARLVDVYIPWGVHETGPGQFDFGKVDPQRDVSAFLRMAREIGLYVIARPGPHINAELTYFGLPERVVWDPSCQARTRSNYPVMLPMLPFAFPVPSYASEAFHDETARWFQALAPELASLVYPDGPIVMFQIDNEGALYFRDGAYDQDYHPDAIALYRDFLREKYRTIDGLQAAYGKNDQGASARKADTDTDPDAEKRSSKRAGSDADADAEKRSSKRAGSDADADVEKRSSKRPGPGADTDAGAGADGGAGAGDGDLRFSSIMPPTRFDAETTAELARHLDWSEFHEHLLATALDRMAKALASAGLGGLPTSHNLPMGQEATPLNAARVTRAVDLVGLDYYYLAGPQGRATIARRTSELAVRCEGLGAPPFACEMGAGFPPFFPPMEERDSAFTVLTALAYGLRGFNIYMAVERDRWIGAPIDPHGRPRPFAAFWRKLCGALEATRFHTLRRSVPVRLLIPRSERRLTRVMNAFGPVTGAIFSVLGAGAHESSLEDDLGLGYPVAVEGDKFARAFELALDGRGVPFAYVGGEDRDVSLEGARWIVCATSGGMNPELFRRLLAAAQGGALVTLGPREPALDGAMRPLAEPLDINLLRAAHPGAPLVLHDDPAAAHAAVARAIEILGLPTFTCDADGIFATVHEDAEGAPRVLFLMNPTASDIVARVTVPGSSRRATDVLDDATYAERRGAFEVRMKPQTARMLALD